LLINVWGWVFSGLLRSSQVFSGLHRSSQVLSGPLKSSQEEGKQLLLRNGLLKHERKIITN
jgi:hypothetical protein